MVSGMALESTIVTLNNLLQLNFKPDFENFIQPPKQIITIPDYQREYKWEKAKIKTFVDQVMQRSKFLGIITVDAPDANRLFLVDGQQRLTTVILMLAQLYNACAGEGETATQDEIQELITCEENGRSRIRLENGSVGEYLHFETDPEGRRVIRLGIEGTADIYKQSGKFSEAWTVIQKEISGMRERNPGVTLDVYKQRLLDCEMLLFAQKNTANMQQGSSEEIYIDINEKAQKLDPEDIFKGHCFAICKTDVQQTRVKTLWCSIKQKFFSMDDYFKKADMGTFLHFYLLTREATEVPRRDIKKDLTIDGENVVTQRYNTPTKVIKLLESMEAYQANLRRFKDQLDVGPYQLSDIMTASAQELGSHSQQIKELKTILRDVMECNQNLFKLPLFYLVDETWRKPPGEKLTYGLTAGFSDLYYLYMFLFSRHGGSRKRENMPKDLIGKIHDRQGILVQFVREIKNYAGPEVDIGERMLGDWTTRKQLYTILDYFKVSAQPAPARGDGDLSIKLQLFPESYNLEHLIVNQSHKVLWRSASYDGANPPPNTEFTFTVDDFRTCPAWTGPNTCWANFIWIDQDFNRNELGNKDIIQKLILLRGSHTAGDAPYAGTYAKKNPHIEIICQHIMSTQGFPELLDAHNRNEPRAVVLDRYKAFLDQYFSKESLEELCGKIKNQFTAKLEELYRVLP